MTLLPSRLSAPILFADRQDTRNALDAFFRDFGFTTRADLERLAGWVLSARGAGVSPDVALALARERVEAWLGELLGPSHASGKLLSRGRAAFVLVDAARLGADVLLREPRHLPEAWRRTFRDAVPVPVPHAAPSVMPEQVLVLNPLAELLRRWLRLGQPGVSTSP
ncbi:hypothetical protein DRW03_07985 [Corallococcus sp. H22C18031201]|nr:hypothetical protein DRW03_07985 [Corallococcus sp. H22C18031201]